MLVRPITDLRVLSDLQKLTEEGQKLFRLYGKLPTHKNVLTKMQKVRPRAVRDTRFVVRVPCSDWLRAFRTGSTLTLGTTP